MNKSKLSILSVLLATLLIVVGRVSVAATDMVQMQGGTARLSSRGEASSVGINQLPSMAPGVVLVGLKPGVTVGTKDLGVEASDASLSATFANIGVQDIESVFPTTKGPLFAASAGGEVNLSRIYRLRLRLDADILHAVQDLKENRAVAYAEPDYLAHIITTPNDPLYSGQWGLAQINAPAAWDVVTGTTDVVIAVIDSGVDTRHPDLAGQLWVNPGEIAGNGLDDDNNGYADDIHGWNLVDNNADLSDNTGHGTEVAGVIAAAANNSEGVAGVCWNCRLMLVKVTQPGGIANYSDIAAGVAYAAQKGAEVINLSLGGYSDSATLRAAIEAASQTAVIVSGAGNHNSGAPLYPAAYNDYVLAVAGTTSTDAKVGTSNYGTWVDVSAPGEVITTTFDGSEYGATSGTSMAAAFASGLAGLLRSQHPDWSADMVRTQIIHTTDDIDDVNPSYEGKLGSGRINAGQAVTTAAQPLLAYKSHAVDRKPGGRPEPGSTVDLEVTLYNDWADATNVQATLSTTDTHVTIITGTASYGNISAFESETNATPFRFSVSSSAPYAHDISFTLDVTADAGYTVTIPLTIPTSPGITYVHGTLTTQTWTNDRIYIVDNNTGIAAGHVLTIGPGTVVRFDGNYSLSVSGTLIADGTEEQPICFTSNQASQAAGDWGQIKFLDSSADAIFDSEGDYTGGSILRHAIIEYGRGVNVENAAPFIAHNRFYQISGSGVSGNGSIGLVVADNTLDSTGINLSVSGGDFFVMRNTISNATLTTSGPGMIAENSVSDASGTGISASGSRTVTANRVVNCGEGMTVNDGFVSENLLANNHGNGLRVNGGMPIVVGNTMVFNERAGVYIQSGNPVLHHNNLVASMGRYALRNATPNEIDATGNWWGTTDDTNIRAAVYDGNDEFGLGVVNYSGYLSGPEQEAPAYLTDVTLTPASPVGIQTVTFDLTFSRPMDQSIDPDVVFDSVHMNQSVVYSTTNSGIVSNRVEAIAIDKDQTVWFATDQGISALSASGEWATYNTSNSGLLNNWILDIAFDREGNGWFGVNNNGVAMRCPTGEWTSLTWDNSPLICQQVDKIAIDLNGNRWFGCTHKVNVLLTSGDWITYTTDNSGLEGQQGTEIAIDSSNNKWFGQRGTGNPIGVSKLAPDGTWTTYNTTNSGLVSDFIGAIAEDKEGNIWFGSWHDGISVLTPSRTWITYTTSNSDLVSDSISDIVMDTKGQIWIATYAGLNIVSPDGVWETFTKDSGNLAGPSVRTVAVQNNGNAWLGTMVLGFPDSHRVSLFHRNGGYTVSDNSIWLDTSRWQATLDIDALIPRDTYTISISSAKGTDGMEIPTDTRFGFTVDYAGEITDQTPPDPPWVIAGGKESDTSTIEAMWWASDPDSPITGYRYAIGSAPGSADIVNWTRTSNTSMTRSGLSLVEGRQYWLAVQARNVGGLWSASGYSPFVAGQPFRRVFLPVVLRNQ